MMWVFAWAVMGVLGTGLRILIDAIILFFILFNTLVLLFIFKIIAVIYKGTVVGCIRCVIKLCKIRFTFKEK
jgi:hypothetical protein